MIPPIRDALTQMFPEGCTIGVCGISEDGGSDNLMEMERGAIVGAAPKRVAEFTAGRRAARSAMAGLGWENVPLPQRADRAPIWPPGCGGRSGHCDALARAVG